MDRQHPIFTEKKECQDCYKCVRNCPVKAIRVENGSAIVMAERCVACGKCVEVCPVHAKHVRDDLGRVRHLLQTEKQVVVSLAPSYVSEFPDLPPGKLIAALRRLGFAAVSETALGAQEVSATVAEALRDPTPRILLSSACPVVVELVNKYLPRHADRITNLCSPLLAHCRLLRKTFGEGREGRLRRPLHRQEDRGRQASRPPRHRHQLPRPSPVARSRAHPPRDPHSRPRRHLPPRARPRGAPSIRSMAA